MTEERSKPSSQLLVIRQIISIFHIVMLSFDHANAMAMYFHADPSLVNSYMSVVFQLRHYFERLEQETGEKLLEGGLIKPLDKGRTVVYFKLQLSSKQIYHSRC